MLLTSECFSHEPVCKKHEGSFTPLPYLAQHSLWQPGSFNLQLYTLSQSGHGVETKEEEKIAVSQNV